MIRILLAEDDAPSVCALPGFLEGAKRTICEQKPILLLSIYHNAQTDAHDRSH